MKARVKSILLSAVATMGIFSVVTLSSCDPDPCKAIICSYGGTCADGDCICPSGYEGTHCEVVTRDKFKGTWTVFENGTSTNPAQYEITFRNGVGATDMTISNFYNRFPGNEVNVRVKGDSLFIPQQTVNNYTIEGWGYLVWEGFYSKHGELTVYYKVTSPEGKADDFGISGGDPSKWNR